MATVHLRSLLLSDALSLSTTVAFHTTKFSEKNNVAGRVQTYASGRQRAVSSVGLGRTVDCQLTLVTPDLVQTLQGWVGRTLLLRDPFGFKEYVTFFDYQRDQQPFPAVSDIPITFRVVTYSDFF